MRQTSIITLKNDLNKKWFIIDLSNQIVGKVATKVASILRGKEKALFTNHVDCGDYVIAINSSKLKFTGNKIKDKMYYNYSGHPSGLRKRNAATMLSKYPNEMFFEAVKGMLPKTRLGRKQGKNLYIYSGDAHNKSSQKPIVLKI